MMQDLLVIIQLAIIAQSHAKELAANQISGAQADSFVDLLVSRALNSSPYQSDLDDSTIAKPGQLANPAHSRPVDLYAMPATRSSSPLSLPLGRTTQKGIMSLKSPMANLQKFPMVNLQNQRRVSLGAKPMNANALGTPYESKPMRSTQVKASETVASPPDAKTFELKKPLGLVLEPEKDGKGAKIVEIAPDGNAAKSGMQGQSLLLSVNGKSTVAAPYDEIMDYMKDLDESSLIKLEVEAAKVEVIPTEPPLAPGVNKIVVDAKDAGAISFKQGYLADGSVVFFVTDVVEDSRAYAKGMRKGMVIKELGGGAGARVADSEWNMRFLSKTTPSQLYDKISLSLRPIDFIMMSGETIKTEIEGSEVGAANLGPQGYSQQYGLGGNSLSGDQKGTLIFASLFGFFLLFLSGYLLN